MVRKVVRRKAVEKPAAVKEEPKKKKRSRAKKAPEPEVEEPVEVKEEPKPKRRRRKSTELSEAVAETMKKQAKSTTKTSKEKMVEINPPAPSMQDAIQITITSEQLTVKKLTKTREANLQELFYQRAFDYDVEPVSLVLKDFVLELVFKNRFKTKSMYNGEYLTFLIEGVTEIFRINPKTIKLQINAVL